MVTKILYNEKLKYSLGKNSPVCVPNDITTF